MTKWIPLAALLLAGCATYSDVQHRTPLHEAETSKTPKNYVECVLPKWLDTNASTHIVAIGDTRQVLMPTAGDAPALVELLLSATPDKSATHVALRAAPGIGKSELAWHQAKACL